MIEVRPASANDIDAAARVHHDSAVAEYTPIFEPYEHLFDDEVPLIDELRAQWAALIDDSTADVYVAVDGPAVIGAAAARVSEDVPGGWLLAKLYARPDRQGEGVGGALLDRVVADARSAGRSEISLWALEPNGRARRFYEARGWTLVPGRTLGNPPTPLVDVLYRLTL